MMLSIAAGFGMLACAVVDAPSSVPPGDEAAPRLVALDPARPAEYFVLGEEIADASMSGPEGDALRRLATELFVLAFALQQPPTDASALLALAAIEPSTARARWLRSLAATVDRRQDAFDWNVASAPAVTDEIAFKASQALGLARSGEAREARRLYEEPEVGELLRRYERAIGDTGRGGAISRLESALSQWPCKECGNARVVQRQGPRGLEVRLCPVCRGNPGPAMSTAELVAQLRFESLLLSGIHRSWAAQTIVDMGAPLRDPEPGEVAKVYGVDPSKPCWRDGQWQPCGGAETPAAPAADTVPPRSPPAGPAPSER